MYTEIVGGKPAWKYFSLEVRKENARIILKLYPYIYIYKEIRHTKLIHNCHKTQHCVKVRNFKRSDSATAAKVIHCLSVKILIIDLQARR